MDAQTIRAAAWELLHAHAAMSPVVLAETVGATVREVCGALGSDQERFERVAGEGCWWWRMSSLAGYGPKRRRPDEAASDGGAAARAYRQRVAVRERIRGALQANQGGATIARLVAATGLAGAEIADQLLGLKALGEVESFTIPGMAGFEFWKESAA
ncbi:MAG: hypothetical protein V4537_18175 [Pseudomonadota bacterium]